MLRNGILPTCSRSAVPPTVLVRISICAFTESYEMDQEESSLQSYATSEELLSPIIRMERFMLSDIIVNRWVFTDLDDRLHARVQTCFFFLIVCLIGPNFSLLFIFYEEHGFYFFLCRQRAARCCQDALRSSKTKEEVYHVLRLMVRLSDDVGERGFLDDHQIFVFSSRKKGFWVGYKDFLWFFWAWNAGNL